MSLSYSQIVKWKWRKQESWDVEISHGCRLKSIWLRDQASAVLFYNHANIRDFARTCSAVHAVLKGTRSHFCSYLVHGPFFELKWETKRSRISVRCCWKFWMVQISCLFSWACLPVSWCLLRLQCCLLEDTEYFFDRTWWKTWRAHFWARGPVGRAVVVVTISHTVCVVTFGSVDHL